MHLPIQSASIRRDWSSTRGEDARRLAAGNTGAASLVFPSLFFCCGKDSACSQCNENGNSSKASCCPAGQKGFFYKTSPDGPCQSCN